MTHAPPRPDPRALAASLRQWALELALWLAEMLGETLGAALRRWVRRELSHAERGAETIVALLAMQRLAPLIDTRRRGGARPLSAPRGFRRERICRNDLRGVTRRLFPREHNLLKRARRLDAVLGNLDAHAARLARRIDRPLAATRLAPVAPPAMRLAPCVEAVAPNAQDTS